MKNMFEKDFSNFDFGKNLLTKRKEKRKEKK